MDKNPSDDRKKLAIAILIIGTALYGYAVLRVGIASVRYRPDPSTPSQLSLPDFIEKSIVVIGAALATHFGSWLGVSITQRALLLNPKGLFSLEGLPRLMAWIYFASLVIALVFWAVTDFSPYSGQALNDMSYTLLGVFAGVGAVYLKEG